MFILCYVYNKFVFVFIFVLLPFLLRTADGGGGCDHFDDDDGDGDGWGQPCLFIAVTIARGCEPNSGQIGWRRSPRDAPVPPSRLRRVRRRDSGLLVVKQWSIGGQIVVK